MAIVPAITTSAMSPKVGSIAVTASDNAVLPVALPISVKAAPEPISINQKNPAGYATG